MTVRRLELVRAAWGALLLVRPRTVLHRADDLAVDRRSVVVVRVLGARQLMQSVLSGLHPSPEVLAMGVWVDAVHSVTAAGLAAGDPRRRRGGAVDVLVAAAWARAGYRDLLSARATPPAHERRRDALARAVLGVVLGGRTLLDRADRARRG